MISISFQSQAVPQEQTALLDKAQQAESAIANELLANQTGLSIEVASYNKAEVKSRVPANYPQKASRRSLEGFSTFSFAVDKNGGVKDI
ncbi:MAG: outer membrane biosynthesis protein TonB [Glaciecola sp.]